MRSAWSGLVLLVGCGGALSGGTGGTGGDGSGGTGIMTGGAGTPGAGGDAGRSAYEGGYTWGATWVYVGPTERPRESPPSGLSFTAQEDIAIVAAATLPASTDDPPTNGARVIAHYGCTNPPLYSVDVEGCARAPNGTTRPGCVSFSVNGQGPMTGEYVDGAGASCVIESGAASIYLPLPQFAAAAGASGLPAIGGYNFFCNRPDGARWYVSGTFAVPAQATVLLCVE